MRPIAGTFVLLTLACGFLPAQPPRVKPPLPPPAGTRIERDLAYGTHARQKLDLYLPKVDGPMPVIVWVHGGGWEKGDKADDTPAFGQLRRGYAVVSVNYRLSRDAAFPAPLADCKAAIRWLRANATQYNLDGDHVGAWGWSAGGHLVALLGTTGGVAELEGDGDHRDRSSRVQAVCDWFGPTDLVAMQGHVEPGSPRDVDSARSSESRMIGGAIADNPDKARKASGITYVTKESAPFLILHGDADPVVPWRQSQVFHDALKKAGVDSTLLLVKGAGHGPGVGSPDRLRRIEEFFDAHLKPKK
jgi:acetyl esterase/lipase